MSGFDPQRRARLAQAMHDHVEQDRVGGVAWLVAAGDHVEVGVAGQLTWGEATPVGRDSIFRISSMTKPIVAAAALILVEEYKLRLDDPVDAASRTGRPARARQRAVLSTGKRWPRTSRSRYTTC